MVVHSSTQNPTEIQAVVAEMLGSASTRSSASASGWAAASAARKRRPRIPAMMAALVAREARPPGARRLQQRRRHARHRQAAPLRTAYWEVGFDDDGRIRAAEFDVLLQRRRLDRPLARGDGAHAAPRRQRLLPAARRDRGRVCFTNLPSNTAFRGFGGPQAMAAIENIIEEIAQHLGLDALDVRRATSTASSVERARITPYGQIVDEQPLAARSSPRSRDRARTIARGAGRSSVSTTASRTHAPRPRADAGEVRHLVHHQVPQPGQRAGQRLHRRHGAGLDRRHRDGPGRQHEDPPARGRRVRPRPRPRRR